ncbi:MAG: hypothetical protein V3R77_07545 [Candidatus Binatia bacterium]
MSDANGHSLKGQLRAEEKETKDLAPEKVLGLVQVIGHCGAAG